MDALLDDPIRDVQLSAGTIRYRDIGSGPPLVFVHGLLVNGQLWRKVVSPLASEFRCIVPDWPLGSHTMPMHPDADLSPPALARVIAEFLAALDLNDATIVGNDTGGAICQLLVTSDSSRVGRLVLTPCDAFENFLPPAFRGLQWGAYVPGFVWLMTRFLQLRWVQRSPLALGMLVKRPMDQAAVDQYVRPSRDIAGVRHDLGKVLRGISNRYTLEAERHFGEFHRPVLIVWAADDVFFPVAHGQRLAEAFPNSRFELVRDARTFIPEDQPAALVDLIRSAVRTASDPTQGLNSRVLTSVKRSA